MSEPMLDAARSEMGAIEKLLKGLPGINGYVDKELRRSVDQRYREQLVVSLATLQRQLLSIQQELVNQGQLRQLTDIDQLARRLQTFADRIESARYGYAGLFNAIRIREEQLAALHEADTQLAGKIAQMAGTIDELQQATDSTALSDYIRDLATQVEEATALFLQRETTLLSSDER